MRDELPPITTFLNRSLALTIDLQNMLFTTFEQLLAARIEGAIASGTYDVGLETLRAESFVVTDRRTIYTHPSTGAETRLLTIAQRERNHPMALKDALDHLSDPRAVLLHNVRSGHGAVQVPAPSLMRDDGEIEQRVRLIRPLERQTLSLKMMAESYWVEADRERFTAAWLAELVTVPEFKSSTIYLVTGLLLPIWKRLPNESTRVYRLQTDTGERIIGRKVSLAWVMAATEAGTPNLTPDAAFTALLDGKIIVDLTRDAPASPCPRHGCRPHRIDRLHRYDAGPAACLRSVQRDHLLEAALLCASRCNRSSDPRQGSGALSGRARRRSDSGVTCRSTWRSWHIASRARPRRCAVTISPTDVGLAITGRSAMSGTLPAARCSSA